MTAIARLHEAGPLRDIETLRDFGPTLVIAPHPDDESLGCGGALALLAELGAHVWVLTLTDGAGSHPNSRRYPPAALRALREREALQASAALGLAPAHVAFLRLPDTTAPREGTPGFAEAATRVATYLATRTRRMETILLPWRREPHCDHRAAWELTQAAVERIGMTARLIEYPIWLWDLGAPEDYPRPGEVAPWRLDVRAALPRKRAAIAAHRSQTTGLIDDDPAGFRLEPEMLERAGRPWELYFEAGASS